MFPIDDETLAYLRMTGPAAPELVSLVERMRRSRASGASLAPTRQFDAVVELDHGVGGSRRSQVPADRRTASGAHGPQGQLPPGPPNGLTDVPSAPLGGAYL